MSTEPARSGISAAEEEKARVRKFLFDLSFHDEAKHKKSSQPPAVFSREELDAARKESYESGFAAGGKAAAESAQQQANAVLEKIDRQLALLIERGQQQWQKILAHSRGTAIAIVRKLMPFCAEKYGVQEIEDLVSRALTEMAHEPRLVVRVGEAQFEAISEKIGALAQQKAYAGKIAVLCENGLGPADCRVEWSDGGVERNMDALWREIEKIASQGVWNPGSDNAGKGISNPAPDSDLSANEPGEKK